MRRYCRAYHLRDLRQFSDWVEAHKENDTGLSEDTICYLWDDFTVVLSPIQETDVLLSNVTSEWQDFCKAVLKFEIPEQLRDSDELVASSGNVSPDV